MLWQADDIHKYGGSGCKRLAGLNWHTWLKQGSFARQFHPQGKALTIICLRGCKQENLSDKALRECKAYIEKELNHHLVDSEQGCMYNMQNPLLGKIMKWRYLF